jgi:hypothetical protein
MRPPLSIERLNMIGSDLEWLAQVVNDRGRATRTGGAAWDAPSLRCCRQRSFQRIKINFRTRPPLLKSNGTDVGGGGSATAWLLGNK